jgi:signal transduction histidine kinase
MIDRTRDQEEAASRPRPWLATSALNAWFARGWSWLVPPELRCPPERLRQANRVLALCLTVSIWIPVFAAIYLALGARNCACIIGVTGIVLVFVPFVQRATRSPVLAGNLVALLGMFCYTGLAVYTGGHHSPPALWYVSVPVLAVLLAGTRWGLFWTAVTVVAEFAFYLAGELGHDFAIEFSQPGLRFLQCAGLVGIVLCVAAITIVFKSLEFRRQLALEEAVRLAEAADRAKSQFLANMSHEIRTPMTAILGFTELLLEDPAARGSGQATEALTTIRRNGEHLLAIINDILDLSKIEAGKLELERLLTSPRGLLNDVAELMQVRIEAKRLTLRVTHDPAAPIAIETDPTRLRQVLINLVGNAIKFTESGGISLASRWLPCPAGGGQLEVEVSDSGIGMTAEQISRIFQPFEQADNSMNRRFGGTGLGLVISDRLVRKLGGEIEVVSHPMRGSTFIVRLEVASVCPPGAASEPADNEPAEEDALCLIG